MQKILQSKIFWTLFVIFSLVIFVMLINTNRIYESRSDILIVAKSRLASENFDQIIEDTVYIPRTLSFYDKMIADNENLTDNFKGLSSFERKLFWKKEIRTERIAKSGIIMITVSNPDKSQAEMIGRQADITLASYLSQAYDIRTDIDLRIIDGPITNHTVRYSFLSLLFFSFLGGFASALIIYWTFLKLSKIKPQGKNISLPISLEKILREKDQKPKSLVYEEESLAASHIPTGTKAAAPDNLPIADEATFSGLKPSGSPDSKKEKKDVANDVLNIPDVKEPTPEEVEKRMNKLLPKDPTPEEVKERLNKLLSGEL